MIFFGRHRVFLIGISLFISFNLLSQSPNGINYQSKLRGSNGHVLSNKNVNLKFEINNTNNNQTLFIETHKGSTDQFGLIDLVIGNGTTVSGSFGNIPWGSGTYELSVYIDTTGFGSYKFMGRSQLYSVPYALYAKNAGFDADWYPGKTGKIIYNIKDSVGVGTMLPDEKLQGIGNIKTDFINFKMNLNK